MKGYLLVRSDGKPYGLPVARVLEVGDAAEVLPVPRTLPAVLGLTPLRGHLVPLIHLGAFLAGRAAPESTETGGGGGGGGGARTIVLVEIKGRHVAFAVDEADAVVREQPLPVPHGHSLPWASGVAERGAGEELVPILDLDALGDRIG